MRSLSGVLLLASGLVAGCCADDLDGLNPTDGATSDSNVSLDAGGSGDGGDSGSSDAEDSGEGDDSGTDGGLEDGAWSDSGGLPPGCGQDVELRTVADVAAVSHCAVLGRVQVWGHSLTEVLLPNVQVIEAFSVTWSTDSLTRIEMPRLERVAAGLELSGPGIETLHLPVLASVGGLHLSNMPHVLELSWLRSLRYVEQGISIEEMNGLISTDGLEGISDFTGSLLVSGNLALERITQPTVVSLEELRIWDNPSLTSLPALRALGSVRASVRLGRIPSLPSLSDLGGVSSIGTLQLNDSHLRSLTGLTRLSSVAELELTDNSLLESLEGTMISGAVNVRAEGNAQLIDLRGLELVATIDSLGIFDNPNFQSFSGLTACRSIRDLSVEDNATLTTLGGFAAQPRLLGGLTVRSNPVLEDLDGLVGLGADLDRVHIVGNPGLQSLTGLNGVRFAEVVIENNPSLASLQGLESLDSNNGITISDNDGLVSLDGLQGLVRTSRVAIRENVQLQDLGALSNLQVVTNSGIDIRGNISLSWLGLTALRTVDWNIGIEDNRALLNCLAVDLIEQVAFYGSLRGSATLAGNLIDPACSCVGPIGMKAVVCQ